MTTWEFSRVGCRSDEGCLNELVLETKSPFSSFAKACMLGASSCGVKPCVVGFVPIKGWGYYIGIHTS